MKTYWPERILDHISKPGYKPQTLKALAKQLQVPAQQKISFRDSLRHLAKQGQLSFGKNHTIQSTRQPHLTPGIVRVISSGAAFVRPEKEGEQDIYIPPFAVGDAMTGDTVMVELAKGRSKLGPRGMIQQVVERATRQFVGIYAERGGQGYVTVDAGLFADPIHVGDRGAKGAKAGDKVVLEMVRFPTQESGGEGVITEVLGEHGAPEVDTLSVIRAFNLPDAFSEEVLQEARVQASRFDEADFHGRKDFTQEMVVTIDPVDARDFDDAVSVRFDSHKKHWHLDVHIADVAYFVPPGGALDHEARDRATSVYLPGRVIPMLPEVISNHLASLQEGQVRYVQSVRMELTAQGEPVHAELVRGAIRVARRFTYEEVSAFYTRQEGARSPRRRRPRDLQTQAGGNGEVHLEDNERPHAAEPAPSSFAWNRSSKPLGVSSEDSAELSEELQALLVRMRELALILRRRRHRRGSLELSMPDVELDYDDTGKVAGAHLASHDISHQVIEEFMLSANEAVATKLDNLGIPFLRRIHPAPEPQKLDEYLAFAQALGYEVNRRTPTDRFQLQRLLEESTGKPNQHAIHYGMLRSLKQAIYSPQEDAHYALAIDHYCHFTSPIRRYPDLTIHRLIARWQQTGRLGTDQRELASLGEHCSAMERRADKAEQELIKIRLLDYLSDKLGSVWKALVTGVESFGFFCTPVQLPVDGLVRIAALTDDYYHYDEATRSLIGSRSKRRFRLGDVVWVEVARVDVFRRRLDFRVVEDPTREPGVVPNDERPLRNTRRSPARHSTQGHGAKPPRRGQRRSEKK
jgi:ribonuclease R